MPFLQKIDARVLYGTLVLVFYCTFLFILTSQVFPYVEQSPSPDGKANLAFAETAAEFQRLSIELPKNIDQNLQKYLIPRSTEYNSSEGSIRPQSYVGHPIFLSFFLPVLPLKIIFILISLIGIISVYLIVSQLFKNIESAQFATILYAFHPIILYYSVHGLMHNLLLMNLVLASIALLVHAQKKRSSWLVFVAGLVLGYAGGVRTSELLWAFPLTLVVLILFSKKRIKSYIFWLVGFSVGLLPFFYYIYTVSGSITQYRSLDASLISERGLYYTAKRFLLPFGFDVQKSFDALILYAENIWPWCLTAVFSLMCIVAYFIFKKQYIKLVFFFLIFFIMLIPVFVYGPSAFNYTDNIAYVSYSHYRYLMPVWVLCIAVIVFAFNLIKNKTKFRLVGVAFLTSVAVYSLLWIIYSPGGLKETKFQNLLAKQRNNLIQERTPYDALIIAGRADKYFFPDRIVAGTIIHKYRADLAKILSSSSFPQEAYYYHTEADISSHWTMEALKNSGIEFTYVTMFFDGGNAWEYLYKIDWPNKEKNGNE